MGRPAKIHTPGENDPKPIEPQKVAPIPVQPEPVKKIGRWELKDDGWHLVD